jgi:hypothetical protein
LLYDSEGAIPTHERSQRGIRGLEGDLRLSDLIVALKNDHMEIRRHLRILRMLVSRGDYELAEKRTVELRTFLDSHFMKEESRVRDILACSPSSSFSSPSNATATTFHKREEVIESMIQIHKAMSDPLKDMHRITTFLTREEKLSVFDNFERTLLEGLNEEEDKDLLTFLIWAINDEQRRLEAQQRKEDKSGRKVKKIDVDIEKQNGDGREDQEQQEEELVLA